MARDDLRPFLGRTVTVTVDRPLGSRHPRHADLCYPINYGYVAGTTGGDGQPVDAYALGIDESVATVEGIVIALVLRADDAEDKLVVAPASRHFSCAEIRSLIDFQERFFESEIVPLKIADLPIIHAWNEDHVRIRVLAPDDWRDFRTLRLDALRMEPAAFSSTYAETLARSADSWRDWLANPRCIVLVAEIGDVRAGIVGGYRGSDDGDESVAIVFGMSVVKAFRGRGIGKRLLSSLLARLSRFPEILTVRLWVTETQEAAQRLYETSGFRVIGQVNAQRQRDGQRHDELMMERPIERGDAET